MIRTQVYLPEELYREAKIQAHIQKTNVSTLIREGLERVVHRLPSRQKPKEIGKGFFGAWKGKVRTNAVEEIHNYYLRDAK